jgi:hemolysin III
VGLLPVGELIRAVGWKAMAVGLVGGVLYTAGGILDALEWPVIIPGVFGWHETLHVLDMGGTLVHVYFVFRYVLPFPAGPVLAAPGLPLASSLVPPSLVAEG